MLFCTPWAFCWVFKHSSLLLAHHCASSPKMIYQCLSSLRYGPDMWNVAHIFQDLIMCFYFQGVLLCNRARLVWVVAPFITIILVYIFLNWVNLDILYKLFSILYSSSPFPFITSILCPVSTVLNFCNCSTIDFIIQHVILNDWWPGNWKLKNTIAAWKQQKNWNYSKHLAYLCRDGLLRLSGTVLQQ